MPSWSSTMNTCGRTWKISRSGGMFTARAAARTRCTSSRVTSWSRPEMATTPRLFNPRTCAPATPTKARSTEHPAMSSASSTACSVDRAFVGVAGAHVRGLNSRGVVAISGRDHEVTHDDVHRVLAAARAVNIPSEREIFHLLPQEFMVDDQDGIHDPIGMSGTKLQANVHIVTALVTAAQNLVNSVNRAGVEVEEVVLEQLAAADAVLSPA